MVPYDWLLRAGMPGFYDKLLQVPLLNLSVVLLDRLAQWPALRGINPASWGQALVGRPRHWLTSACGPWPLACNELGILLAEQYDNPTRAAMSFERACSLLSSAGCENAAAMERGAGFRREAPALADYQFILRGSKGPIRDRDPPRLYARACAQGWPGTCGIQ